MGELQLHLLHQRAVATPVLVDFTVAKEFKPLVLTLNTIVLRIALSLLVLVLDSIAPRQVVQATQIKLCVKLEIIALMEIK
jgi:hypothetical protein